METDDKPRTRKVRTDQGILRMQQDNSRLAGVRTLTVQQWIDELTELHAKRHRPRA